MTAAAPSPSSGVPWRQIALSAYGPTVLTSAAVSAIYPVMVLRAQQLGASLGMAAFVLALAGVAQLLVAIPAGALVARVGERTAMIWAGLVDLVAFSAAGLTNSLLVMALATFAGGAGSTIYWLARQTFLVEVVPRTHTARAMSTLGGMLRIGALVGPLCAGPIIALWGIQAAYALAAFFSAAALAVVVFAADITGRPHLEVGERPTGMATVLRRHSKLLGTVGVGMIGLGGLREVRTIILPLWGVHIGLDGSTIAGVFAAAAAVEILLFYPAGYAMDRWGRVALAVGVPLSVGLALLALPLATRLGPLTAVAVVTAIGNGFGAGIVMTLGADLSPEVDRTQFLAGWRLCSEIGRGGLPVLFSALAGGLGLAAASVSMGILGVASAAWLAAFLRTGPDSRAQLRGSAPSPGRT